MDTIELMKCFQKEVNFSSPLFRRALAAEVGTFFKFKKMN